MKTPIVAANWKLHKNPIETRKFVEEFLRVTTQEEQQQFIIFPPAIDLTTLAEALDGSPVGWGAQNVYSQSSGAFTGENSAQTVKDIGAGYVLLGHSERRRLFHEQDDLLADKVAVVQQVGLTPLLCVGETLKERESDETQAVIERQLQVGFCKADWQKPVMLAYEPVWAIGTGKVASAEQAGQAHEILRSKLSEMAGDSVAQTTPILYGGSVKPDNAKILFTQPHIAGFLVGGASLSVDSLVNIQKQSSNN